MAEKLTRENVREGIFVKFETEYKRFSSIRYAKIITFDGSQLRLRAGIKFSFSYDFDCLKNAVILDEIELLEQINSLQDVVEQTAKYLVESSEV